jgi:hypothetical protein
MMTPEEQGEARRQGLERRRREQIERMAGWLTPEQAAAYKRWERLCEKYDIPVTPQARLEWLKEMDV